MKQQQNNTKLFTLQNFKAMTLQEFYNRVQMTVTSSEFVGIHAEYMATDLDKDDFCEMWAERNKARIAEYKKEIRKAERKEKAIADVRKWKKDNSHLLYYYYRKCVCAMLSDKDLAILKKAGFEFNQTDTIAHVFNQLQIIN